MLRRRIKQISDAELANDDEPRRSALLRRIVYERTLERTAPSIAPMAMAGTAVR